MREIFISAVICWVIADAAMIVYPVGSVVAQDAPIRFVTVFVCAPKDHARIVPGMIIPRVVTPELFTAASMSPVAQAAEQRGKRRR